MKTINQYLAATIVMLTTFFNSNLAAAQTSGPLYNEIAHQDSLQFGAFNARNLDQLMNYFDSSLELYQDNTGVRNYDQTKQAFGGLFKMNYTLTRKLVPGTMEVYPIKDYGAIETGKHTFSHMEMASCKLAPISLCKYGKRRMVYGGLPARSLTIIKNRPTVLLYV